MRIEERMKNLLPPEGEIDVVLDTDAYNEIDDQFAIAYLLRDRTINTRAIYAAPFHNARSASPADGMEKSYAEILRLLSLLEQRIDVYRGSEAYLPNEKTACDSEAARDLASRVDAYSPEKPLYIVAIGAITNVASAYLLNPRLAENAVVVWLGGHAHHYADTREFNLWQDVAAARVIMQSGVPFVQLPCMGVVSSFTVSRPELVYWLKGKGALADYLADAAIREADGYAKGKPWTRVIWDVTAVAWLKSRGGRFMKSRILPTSVPSYSGQYEHSPDAPLMSYVYHIHRDALLEDLIRSIVD